MDTKDKLIEKLKEVIKYLKEQSAYTGNYSLTELESEITELEKQLEQEQKEQPKTQAWECPRCYKIHSYLSLECDCPPRTITKTTYDGTIQKVN